MAGQLTKEQGPIRLVQLKDGRQSIEIRLDALHPPTDSYHADWYTCSLDERTVHFVFGKLSVTKKHLVTVLDVSVPQVALGPLRESFGRERDGEPTFIKQLEAFALRVSLTVGQHADAGPLVNATTKEHSVASNFALLGYSDNDAALSFYRLPPTFNFAKLQAEELSKVKVNPVVRVDTTASILLSFCRDIIRFADGVAPAEEASK